jgi:hypothetical protein
VGQTLDFALETKVPGKRPAGLSRQDFKEKVINLMLKMFNIEHTRNTIVGNPFVRGASDIPTPSSKEHKRPVLTTSRSQVVNGNVCPLRRPWSLAPP